MARARPLVVVGAGPAGATVARILALRGLEILLVDPLARPVDRLEMVAPATRPLLNGLGLDDLIADPEIACPCPGFARRWGDLPEDFEDFFRKRPGAGHVVDRRRFDAALRARAIAAGAGLVPARVARVARRGADIVLALSDGTRVRTDRVIDASGRPALIARRLGARRLLLERVVARRVAADAARAMPRYMRVEGDADGWRYWIDGPGGRSESWRLTGGAGAGSGGVDASSARLDRAAGPGWLAVGDAAASYDPITSQGLANALSTAQIAAGMILDGDRAAPAAYADAVRRTHARSETVRVQVHAARGPAAWAAAEPSLRLRM